MGYMHIDNLYRPSAQRVLAFREVYALEKIHGTSANVSWRDGAARFHSGGETHDRFVALFDVPRLATVAAERYGDAHVIVYGEAYGGKQQQMSQTYGTELRFVAFDVRIGACWLDVPMAHEVVDNLGLEFVDYSLVPATLEALDAERDRPSTQAKRNGVDGDRIREGIVIRPPFEVTLNNGLRVVAKHKRAEFAERGRPKVELDPAKREMLAAADAIAAEWVTPMRLEHVIDQLLSARDDKVLDVRDTGELIRLMISDVEREAAEEALWSKAASRACGKATARLLKRRLSSDLARRGLDTPDSDVRH